MFSRQPTRVELLLFDDLAAPQPVRVIGSLVPAKLTKWLRRSRGCSVPTVLDPRLACRAHTDDRGPRLSRRGAKVERPGSPAVNRDEVRERFAEPNSSRSERSPDTSSLLGTASNRNGQRSRSQR